MPTKLNPFSMLLGAVLVAACSTAPATRHDRQVEPALASEQTDAPTLEYLGTELRQYGYDDDPYFRFMDIIRFSNQSSVAWEFRGEDVTWPPWFREIPTADGEWETEMRYRCITLDRMQRIEPGQVALFPAHSTRSPVGDKPGRYSRVALRLTSVETGEEVVVRTDGYVPTTTPEDEERALALDDVGHLRE